MHIHVPVMHADLDYPDYPEGIAVALVATNMMENCKWRCPFDITVE